MLGLDPLTWAALAFVAAIFWLPQAAVCVGSVAALLRHRRGAPPGRRPLLRAGAGCALAAIGWGGGLVMLYGWVIGSGLGGYTAPAEALAFHVVTLSPIVVSSVAAMLAGGRLLAAALGRREPGGRG